MRGFNFSEVEELVAQEGLVGEEVRMLYWRKFCEYLIKEKCDSVPIGLIDRIDKKCDGFHDFAFEHVKIDTSNSLSAQMVMRRRRKLRWKYNRVIKEVVKSGVLSPEYEEYVRKTQVLQQQLTIVRHKKPWKVFLVLKDGIRVQVIY